MINYQDLPRFFTSFGIALLLVTGLLFGYYWWASFQTFEALNNVKRIEQLKEEGQPEEFIKAYYEVQVARLESLSSSGSLLLFLLKVLLISGAISFTFGLLMWIRKDKQRDIPILLLMVGIWGVIMLIIIGFTIFGKNVVDKDKKIVEDAQNLCEKKGFDFAQPIYVGDKIEYFKCCEQLDGNKVNCSSTFWVNGSKFS